MASRLTEVQRRVLSAVVDQDIGRSNRGHRWWLDEIRYRTLTQTELLAVRNLHAQGLIVFEPTPGYQYNQRGYYALTQKGKAAL